jgi:hypothetical protein
LVRDNDRAYGQAFTNRVRTFGRTRRYDGPCKELGPSSPSQSCPDCIIATRGYDFREGQDPWLDTTSAHGELILTIMGGIAEFERKLIRSRCDEGIKRAKARGVLFGRKPVLDAGERRRIAERHAAGETMAVLAKDYQVGVGTIHRALHGN